MGEEGIRGWGYRHESPHGKQQHLPKWYKCRKHLFRGCGHLLTPPDHIGPQ